MVRGRDDPAGPWWGHCPAQSTPIFTCRPAGCASTTSDARRLIARAIPNPISRMGHLGGRWLAGSLADECCPEELAPLVEHVLLDHLVRPLEQRLRDRQAEGLRGLQVYDQLERSGLLDR